MFGLFETGFASFYLGNGVMLASGAIFLKDFSLLFSLGLPQYLGG